MKNAIIALALTLTLAGCDKVGADGTVAQMLGSWAQVTLPDGCIAKQIAASENNGVAVLCEDGRVFH